MRSYFSAQAGRFGRSSILSIDCCSVHDSQIISSHSVNKGVVTWAKVTSLVCYFVDSEAYHEQMGPIPSSNLSLDIALSNGHT